MPVFNKPKTNSQSGNILSAIVGIVLFGSIWGLLDAVSRGRGISWFLGHSRFCLCCFLLNAHSSSNSEHAAAIHYPTAWPSKCSSGRYFLPLGIFSSRKGPAEDCLFASQKTSRYGVSASIVAFCVGISALALATF
jgi:hypothetical protein